MKLRIEPSHSGHFEWIMDPDAMDYTAEFKRSGKTMHHRFPSEQYFLEWLMASESPKTVSILEEQIKGLTCQT